MIEFTRADLDLVSIHYVGNKGLGDDLTLTEKTVKMDDDFLKLTIMNYFTHPFKDDIYYKFKNKNEMNFGDVKSLVEDVFKDKGLFIESSKGIASHLYNQTMHPKINSGELIVTYFRDVLVDGVICDAVGIFKSEKKHTYLKIEHKQETDMFDFEPENGINISKLDKGALIFNTNQEDGYKISIIDTNNKVSDAAFYWTEDFLNTKLVENSFYHTQNFLHTYKGFCEEVLIEENNVTKEQQMIMQNRSVDFLEGKTEFVRDEFQREVLAQPELIEAYNQFEQAYNEKLDLNPPAKFEVSKNAVKKNTKIMKSVIKLDKNFVINVKATSNLIEKGYDDEKGMKFYKLFFVNEA